MQELANFFDASGSPCFSVADALVNRGEGLIVFILDYGCWPVEVELLYLSHNPS